MRRECLRRDVGGGGEGEGGLEDYRALDSIIQ